MANSVPKIVSGGFSVDKGLDDHPVYFLTVGLGKLVVKGEAKGSVGHDRSDQDAATSIKWGSKLMKNVNDQLVNTKIMEQSEVTAFLAAASRKFKPLPPLPGGPPAPPAPNRYKNVTVAAQQYTWVKMPAITGLSDAEFTKKINGFTTPIKGKVKEQIIKFTDETVWPQLGKVVAVDIFNGNSDRFDITTGKWINYGNVMFTDQGTKVIGLDTFDPNAKQSNLVGHGRFDELKTLTDTSKQRAFALACTKSVGETLEFDAFTKGQQSVTLKIRDPNGDDLLWQIKRGEVNDLYTNFAPAMQAGIAKGANELKVYLQRKVVEYRQKALTQPPRRPLPPTPGQVRPRAAAGPPPRPDPLRRHVEPIHGIPQGILDRMHFIGWI